MSEPVNETQSAGTRFGGGVPVWITAVLAISAAITIGFWMVMAVGEEDTEALESPLMLSVARQLVIGPGELYGPFGGSNPLVLIHAPLYYRVAGLAAWPMARGGLHPVTAARISGRSLSALGLLATLAVAYQLGRIGGGSRLAGWWAVLLVASAPVLSGQPFAVRPDMTGVALQTVGVLLVLSALGGGIGAGRRVIWGYAAFGLAACVKQHMVAEAAVSTVLLLLGWRRGQVRPGAILRGLAVAFGIVVFVYGVEWVITAGRIWEAAFVAARDVGRLHPGGWDHVLVVVLGLLNRAIGLIVLLSAVGLARIGASPGIGRKVFLVTGFGVIVLILVTLSLHYALGTHPEPGVVVAFAACGLMGVVFPVCALIERSALLGNRIDAALWVYATVELGLAMVFFYVSTGSWMNYAIQSIVFGTVLTARAASRVVQAAGSPRSLWPVVLAVLAVMISACNHLLDSEVQMFNERAAAETVFTHLKQPASAFFFVNRPGFNRVGGRLELVYDDWLYPVFESLHLAEPRSAWLSRLLRSDSVRGVVATSPSSRIEGTAVDLWMLGYHPDISAGPFYVWTR